MDTRRASGPAPLAGRYQLGALLGHGGMGEVRDATDQRLRRPVAVKILRADLAEQPTARRRFETEARAAARLAHPNVVTVFDSGEDDGIPFLVMERLPGRTFADELAAGPVPLDRVHDVVREILAALAAAHAAGIVHRDIKPGNVLLTEDGHVKVSDFGIAKTIDDLDQTQTAELVATPGYLAPERLTGEPASPRSDLYSVGVLLYEALSGRRPFEGDTPLALIRAIERGRARPLASVRPDLPPEVVAVVDRAMARDPHARVRVRRGDDRRVATVDAVRSDRAGGRRARSSRRSARSRVARRCDAHVAPAEPEAGGRAPRARRRLLVLGVGAAVAGLLVAGAVGGQHPAGHPAPTRPAPTPTVAAAPSTTAKPTPATPTPAPKASPPAGHGHRGSGNGGKHKGDNGDGNGGND